jgi:hypothetical protein
VEVGDDERSHEAAYLGDRCGRTDRII